MFVREDLTHCNDESHTREDLELRNSISFELDPQPSSIYTVQSAEFAIEAKKYIKLNFLCPKKTKNENQCTENSRPNRGRKRVKVSAFLSKLFRHKKIPKNHINSNIFSPEEIILQELIGESTILRSEDIHHLGQELPTRVHSLPWSLQFCSSRDGYSLHNLYRKLSKSSSPSLLVIEDLHGRVFGALASSPLKISEKFYGTSECFLFMCDPSFQVFKWSGDNFYFIQAHEEFLAFGCSCGKYGLWIDSDLNKGRTDSCLTFRNPPLLPENDFVIKNFECWTFN